MTPRSFLLGLVAASLLAAPHAGAQQTVSQPAGSVSSGAYVAGSFADGSSITFGLKADAATCATSNTAMACLRQLHADLIAPLPAGTNAIGSITNTGFNALQGGAANSLTNPFYTAPATGSTQPISGTVTATQSGTWTVQPGNTANTTAWLVTGTGGTFPVTAASLPLPSGAATAANQNVTAAGTSAANAQAIQGVTSGVPVPVSGTVAVGAGSALIGKVGIDQTTPGTTNGVQTLSGSVTNATLQSGSTTTVTQATAANLNATVVGAETAGSAVTGGGLRMMGSDGTNARDVQTNTLGAVFVTNTTQNALRMDGSSASGAADGGNPVKVGGVYNSTLPTFTTGQRGDLQISNKGSINTQYVDANGNIAPLIQPTADGRTAAGLNTLPVTVFGSIFNGASWDRAYSIQGAAATGLGTLAVHQAPTSAAGAAIAPSDTTAVASSLILKASAGNGYRYAITTGASAGFLLIFDAATAPADGAVTPKICRAVAANTSLEVDHADAPDRFSTGITEVFSTTGCYTKTASATAALEGNVE